jgi:hypothetical protein
VRRVVAAVLTVPLLAGCGSVSKIGADITGKSSTTPKPVEVTRAQDAVLGLKDIGYGWLAVPSQTKILNLADSMKGDPASIKALEQRSFQTGYQALFASGRKVGVLSAAFTYSSDVDAEAIADGWLTVAGAKLHHPKRLTTPLDVPGQGFALFRATTRMGKRTVPLYAAQWVDGNVIASVVTFGAGVRESDVLRLAKKQDAKLLAAAAV